MNLSQRALLMIAKLHDVLDELVTPLHQLHDHRLQCSKGCSSCCVDDLTVFEVEAQHIVEHAEELLATATPAPKGQCAFLDPEGACRVYHYRPYVCRTQGLPLRWVEEDPQTLEITEYRDICPLNIVEGEPVALLPAEQLWAIGPFESKLNELQQAFNPDEPQKRIALRSLFAS